MKNSTDMNQGHVHRLLRELMHILPFYIDDIYLQGDSELKCIQNIAVTITLLHELGFTLHPDKCQLIPSTKIKTLGFIVDSVEVKVTLTQDKTENILSLLKHNIRKNVIKIRELARSFGKLLAAFPASKYGPLHFRNLKKDKIITLEKVNGNYEACTTLSNLSKKEMQWWMKNLPHMFNVIHHKTPSVCIYSDASNLAWGSSSGEQVKGGHRNNSEINCYLSL